MANSKPKAKARAPEAEKKPTPAEEQIRAEEPEEAKEDPVPEQKPKPEKKPKPKSYLVNKERRRLLKLFEGIDENKKDFVKEQVTNLAWYTVSVKILQERIDEYGTMIRYDNGGGQSGYKENPDVKTMLGYQKNVNDITRQLTDLVPAKRKESRLAAFARAE